MRMVIILEIWLWFKFLKLRWFLIKIFGCGFGYYWFMLCGWVSWYVF